MQKLYETVRNSLKYIHSIFYSKSLEQTGWTPFVLRHTPCSYDFGQYVVDLQLRPSMEASHRDQFRKSTTSLLPFP